MENHLSPRFQPWVTVLSPTVETVGYSFEENELSEFFFYYSSTQL
jgi:hypothetical protein